MAKQFKNIVGTAFPEFVKQQLKSRSEITQKIQRNSKDILWLTNRSSFYRITSGAKINNSDTTAKNFILQGGSVRDAGNGNVELRETFKDTYQRGPNNELGFRPMPNASSLEVGTGGRWQTLLQAEVTIEAYNLDQLETISKLYMSLGVHVFIEWGHAPYVKFDTEKNKTNVITDTIRPINFFDFSGPKGLTGTLNKSGQIVNEGLLQKISATKAKYQGNYEAFVGRVYNFDYNANPDGSYTCKIKVMGAGAMVDSLRGISQMRGPDSDQTPSEETEKYSSDLANSLISMRQAINLVAAADKEVIPAKDTELGHGKSIGEIVKVGAGSLYQQYKSGWESFTEIFSTIEEYANPSYGKVLESTYGKSSYNGVGFSKSGGTAGFVFYNNNLAAFGHATPLLHTLGGQKNEVGLNPITTDFYAGYGTSLSYTVGDDNKEVKAAYITLGHLFCLVQHLGVFSVGTEGDNLPGILLDYHPDNTIVRTGTIQASIDPTICLVPFREDGTSFSDFLDPLDLKSKKKVHPDYSAPFYLNFSGANRKTNAVNKVVPSYDGKLFNILVNIDFCVATLKNLKNNKNNRQVALREYLDNILGGINRALGNINDFKLNYNDTSCTLRVIDQNHVEKNIEFFELPVFGQKSIAYDYNYSSKISKDLAAQIVIATQAEGSLNIKDYPEDVFSYFELNGGITDRFTDKITTGSEDDTDEKKTAAQRAPLALLDLLSQIYQLNSTGPINNMASSDLVNFYNDLQLKYLNLNAGKAKKSILIPLEMSVTLDGISGILPYNAFLLPNNRLPERYKNRIAFIVFSINHKFENNNWFTELRGQTIMKP